MLRGEPSEHGCAEDDRRGVCGGEGDGDGARVGEEAHERGVLRLGAGHVDGGDGVAGAVERVEDVARLERDGLERERVLAREVLEGAVEGEADEDNVRRELVEEVGRQAGTVEFLTSIYPSAGMTDSVNSIFMATDLTRVERTPHGPEEHFAEILEIPEGTVAWRVNEARRLLKLRLAATPDPSTDPTPAIAPGATVSKL